MAKKKKNQTAMRRTLIVLCVVLGVILAALIAVTVYAEYLLGKVNYIDPDATVPTLSQEQIDALYQPDEEGWEETEFVETDPTETDLEETDPVETDPTETDPEETEPEETAPVIKVSTDNIKTFLLIGADNDKTTGVSRTDSIILCTFNKTKKTITLTSLMRDTYVSIPGYSKNRVNVAYSLGGLPLLQKTLEQNFDIVTDGTVVINFENFRNLINYVGGIEIELTKQEANYLNSTFAIYGVKVKEGLQTLDGFAALEYARCRALATGDLARTNRQRIVLSTLLNKYKNLSKAELLGVMDDVLPMVTTDMSKEDILGHFLNFFPMLAEAEIVSVRVPADNALQSAMRNGMSVIVPDIAKCKKALAEILYE